MPYDQYIGRLKDMAGFAVMISLLVVPAVAAIKARIPNVKGWATVLSSLVIACLIVGGLVHPNSLSATFDCLLIGFMAAVIALGGDAYVLRILGKLKGSAPIIPITIPSPTNVSTTVTTESKGDGFDVPETPTKPDIKLPQDEK